MPKELRERIVRHIDEVKFGAHGLHVRLGGEECEHRWTPDVREEIHSVAKGVAVLAAGIAADEGLISLDDKINTLLPDVTLGHGVGEVTLRHLLTMTSGIDLPWTPTLMTDYPDLGAEFLSRPSSGRVYQYSNASTYTAMYALSQRTGDVESYVQSKLFTPLGIDSITWARCPNGRVKGGEGITLRTSEMARLGQLIHGRGVFQETRIVSAETVDAMHMDWIDTKSEYKGYERYALGGWDGPGDAWRLHGAYGQLIILVGEAVVTITADDHAGADALAAWVVDSVHGM
jgi:CubicO group peptidase (beta-lactamase class C family)